MTPIAVHAGNSSPVASTGNWTWLINGRVPTLIDAGVGMAQHLDEVEHHLRGAALAQVVITHSHPDHIAGAPALAARFPDTRFFKPSSHKNRPGTDINWDLIADGQELAAGNTSLVALHTPGHSGDHFAFWHRPTGALFSGDLFIRGSATWIPPDGGGDMGAYVRSVERLASLEVTQLFPAHGAPIVDATRFLQNTLVRVRASERNIIAAVAAGETTVPGIVLRVHGQLEPSWFAAVNQTTLAYLIKLQREGVVRRRGIRWTLADG